MDIDRQKLRQLLQNHFNIEEFRTLCFELRIDYDALAGEGTSSKVRELIVYMDRRGRLDELVDTVRHYRPHIDWDLTSVSETTDPTLDARVLNLELAGLRQQLDEIKKGAITDEQLNSRLEEMLRTTSRAIGRSEELTARVFLPPPELTDVQLLPSGALERLEEYRSDENLAYLLVGAFGGAILGILSNWATNDPFVITRFSIILLVLLAILTVACGFWARRLHQRASQVKEQIFASRERD